MFIGSVPVLKVCDCTSKVLTGCCYKIKTRGMKVESKLNSYCLVCSQIVYFFSHLCVQMRAPLVSDYDCLLLPGLIELHCHSY